MAGFSIGFQPDLIGIMSQFEQFDETLKKHIATATEKSAAIIGDFQVEYMGSHFQNPTGRLADSVGMRMITEYQAWIGPQGVPYDWRRDRGFSGMTDSLGRFYRFDFGIYYAEESIVDPDVLFQIAENYIDAVYSAWTECIGSLPNGTSAEVAA